MYRGCTRLEAVGLVCNFSGKLLTGTFSGQVVQFFLQPPCLETSDDEFFPLYSYNKYLCIVLFSWRSEAVKFYFMIVPEQSLKTVEEKRAVYQIRRPLGLAFVIYFGGWENCCRSIFSWTLICSSLPQSPDLLVFPAIYTPPPTHTLIVGPHLNLNHGGVSLTKLTCS